MSMARGDFQRCRFAALSDCDVLSETVVRGFLSRFSHAARPARLTLVRQLAQYLVLQDPRTFVPPRRFLGIRRKRPVIRVLSRNEACRFLDSCDRLPDTARYARRLIHGTALRVLLLTGLRQGEAIGLRDQDVDSSQSIITVCNSKFGRHSISKTIKKSWHCHIKRTIKRENSKRLHRCCGPICTKRRFKCL